MLRAALTILVALLVAIAAFVVLAPASLLDRRLAAATGDRLRLVDAEGTVWRGRGAIGDAHGRWRLPVAWRIEPLPLAQGALAWSFEPRGGGEPRGHFMLRESGLDVRDATIALPAAAVRAWIGDGPLPEPGGTLRFDALRFRHDFRSGDGAIDVRWDRARLAWSGAVLDLGTVRARIVPRGAELSGTLDNSGGEMRVNGDFAVSMAGATARATLVPGPGVPPAIARGLASLGPADASGAVRIEWRSSAR